MKQAILTLALLLASPWAAVERHRVNAAEGRQRVAGTRSEWPDEFLRNGVTAHRGNSSEFPENTMQSLASGIEVGADWIELDIFRTRDGRLVVIHDRTTERVGDQTLSVPDSSYQELLAVDVATEFRERMGKTTKEIPPQRVVLLEDVLRMVMKQGRTRVSIQPKMACVPEAVALVKELGAERWVGFNDGSLRLMSEVKRLAPEIPVFWDRGGQTDIESDIRTAEQHGFESLVLHHSGITPENVRKVREAGLEIGAWTVNDQARMEDLLEIGVERIYTDYPVKLIALQRERRYRDIACEGAYPHHLQGICVDESSIYWSFTTTLVKTDLDGKVLKQMSVANHHGDLCYQDGKLYVAVNLGKFNDPNGNADSWVYVYDAASLQELGRHEIQEVFYGAGGIGFHDGRFYVVGGLPSGFEENYVYEYNANFAFVKKHVVKSGHTLLGIQTATFAHGRWWFGCYGDPQILLVTDAGFSVKGRYEFDTSLGIEALPGGRLFSASGRCEKGKGCTGRVRVVIPDETVGLKFDQQGP